MVARRMQNSVVSGMHRRHLCANFEHAALDVLEDEALGPLMADISRALIESLNVVLAIAKFHSRPYNEEG
jgi:hypothetical protein